jgi:hypothetical protein
MTLSSILYLHVAELQRGTGRAMGIGLDNSDIWTALPGAAQHPAGEVDRHQLGGRGRTSADRE